MSKTAILVASRNRKDLVDAFGDWAARNVKTPHDLYVVECGSAPEQWSARSTLAYDDPEFLGKCFGHNLLLRQAMTEAATRGGYDDYWVVMNDLVFPEGVDPLARLHDAFERQPRLALVSPTEVGGHYPGAEQQSGSGVRPITTCDYLGFLIRAAAVREAGFLNPAFRYCWGAIHELSFQLHRRGWWLGYSDAVSYRHLGGSTYGAKNTQTISRAEYQRRARRFAYPYFQKLYGADWEKRFFAAARPFGATLDTYAQHRAYWATAFTAAELAELDAQASALADEELASDGALTTVARRSATLPIGWRSNPCALTPQHDRLLGRVQARSLLGGPAAHPVVDPQPTAAAAPPQRSAPAHRPAPSARRSTTADVERLFATGRPRRLMLGCGTRPDPRAINVDCDPTANADLFLDVSDLSIVPDGSMEEIRSYHLFEHLTRNEARRALREWHRVLVPGGVLSIECPNLAVCVREVGRHFDERGDDLAMIGIYGDPNCADQLPMRHKWGWSPETLAKELDAAGFRDPTLHPVEQTWRPATRFGRDMQVHARK